MAHTTTGLLRSGVPPIDHRLGGLVPGRVHLLGGTTGSGKSTAGLHFIDDGVRRGEPIALITADVPADLRGHAEWLGFDLRPAWRDGRLVVIRFRGDVARRLGRAAAPEAAADELRRLLDAHRPRRIVIDSLGPLLGDGHASLHGLRSIIDLLEETGATTLATYPGDPAAGFDRRLEVVAQRAAVVLRLEHEGLGRRLTILKARYAPAGTDDVRYTISAGAGFAVMRPGAAAAPAAELRDADRFRPAAPLPGR